MRDNGTPKGLIGKTVTGLVVVPKSPRQPEGQLFLVLDHGESFECWFSAGKLSVASQVDKDDLSGLLSKMPEHVRADTLVYEGAIGKPVRKLESQAELKQRMEEVGARDLWADEALYLAINERDLLLEPLSLVSTEPEVEAWAELLNRGFARLIMHADLDHLDSLYKKNTAWNRFVRPPSVVAHELMYFLGRLSKVAPDVFLAINSKGGCQAFLRLVDSDHFVRGQQEY